MSSQADQAESFYDLDFNPLDNVEDILARMNWTYSRMNRNEIFMQVQGQHGVYRMMFMWNKDTELMQFCCEYDIRLADIQYNQACQIINNINYGLWVGHFHVSPESLIPCFRHTQMFRGLDLSSASDHLEDLIKIALDECDFHYPALLMLAGEKTHDEEQLAFALMPIQGQS
jgi:hypothetical protein